jgi:hypothetical protein
MALYLISYDLIKPEKDYPDLLAALRKMGAKKVLYSEWMLDSDTSITDLFDAVRTDGKLDANDKLLVVEVSNWTYVNTMFPIENI